MPREICCSPSKATISGGKCPCPTTKCSKANLCFPVIIALHLSSLITTPSNCLFKQYTPPNTAHNLKIFY